MINLEYYGKYRLRDRDSYERVHINTMADFSKITAKKREIVISGLNQERFEYFCIHFANQYEIVQIESCNLISDFAPLKQLDKVCFIIINWVQKAVKLWDMSGNLSLQGIWLKDINKLTSLDGLETAPKLSEFYITQDVDKKIYLDTLAPLGQCKNMESVFIRIEGVRDGSALPITKIKTLKKAIFNTTLFEMEQFAMLAVWLKNIDLSPNAPYIVCGSKDDFGTNNVMITGKGRRWLSDTSPKLKEIEAEWNAYIEKYSFVEVIMTPYEFAKMFFDEKESLINFYKENKHIANLNLDETQHEVFFQILDQAITDTMYTILLGLDGCATIGGIQCDYKLYDEGGNLLAGDCGELEAAAYKVFYEDNNRMT